MAKTSFRGPLTKAQLINQYDMKCFVFKRLNRDANIFVSLDMYIYMVELKNKCKVEERKMDTW